MPISRGDVYGRNRTSSSFRGMDRVAGSSSQLAQQLYPSLYRDVVFRKWEMEDVIFNVTDYWTTNAGTGATAFAVSAAVNGNIRAATGTDATAGNRFVNLYGPLCYRGNHNCGMEVAFALSNITQSNLEIGFIDTYTTITTPVLALTDIDTIGTWAAGLGDAAVLEFQPDETIATMRLASIGSSAVNTGTLAAVGDITTPTAAPAIGSYDVVRIQLAGNSATLFFNNVQIATTVAAINGGVTVRPYITFANPAAATSRTMDIDYIAIWQDRAARTA